MVVNPESGESSGRIRWQQCTSDCEEACTEHEQFVSIEVGPFYSMLPVPCSMRFRPLYVDQHPYANPKVRGRPILSHSVGTGKSLG